MPAKPCILCAKSLDSGAGGLIGGAAFSAQPGYGSKYDGSLLCEQQLEVNICDECLEKHAADVDVVYTPRPLQQSETRTMWDPRRHQERYDGGDSSRETPMWARFNQGYDESDGD